MYILYFEELGRMGAGLGSVLNGLTLILWVSEVNMQLKISYTHPKKGTSKISSNL